MKTSQMGLCSNRHKPILFSGILLLALAALGCGASVRLPLAGLIQPPTATFTSTLPPLPSSPTPTFSPSPFPTLTSLPTAAPTETPTPRPAASAKQLHTLAEVWNAVNENYLYEDFNGVDWEAVYQKYRRLVEAGLDDETFYLLMDEMIRELGDEHSTFFSPLEAQEEDASFNGEYDYVGIGIITAAVPERQRVTIILVFPGSPAAAAGLQAHDNILQVDGEPILDENGDRRSALRGPAGSQVTLTIQTPGQASRQVSLTRERISSPLPVPSQVLASSENKRIGYLLLTTFQDRTVPRNVRRALQGLAAGGRLHGLIIDNRYNEGGADIIFEAVLSLFEDGRLGHYENRQERAALAVSGRDIAGSQKLPLVVLVGPGTASFGEIFAGVLKDTQRAHLIGQTTDGNVEILYVYDFSDGSRAWVAHDRFIPLNHPEHDWELNGIVPHSAVTSNWDEVTQTTDPVIQAALEYFDNRE